MTVKRMKDLIANLKDNDTITIVIDLDDNDTLYAHDERIGIKGTYVQTSKDTGAKNNALMIVLQL